MPEGIIPNDVKKELIDFFGRWYLYILYVVLGMIAHISNLVLSKRKITWAQTFASIGAAFVCGCLSSMYCAKYAPQYAVVLVPFFTLVSDKIFAYVSALDYQEIFDGLVAIFRPKK